MKKNAVRYDEEYDRWLFEDILDFLKTFVALSLVIVILAFFIVKPAVVSGKSMLPLFENGQKGFSSIISLWMEGIQRGDVVVAKAELEDGTANLVKRVIGLPGETISCENETIYIDGEPLDESAWMDGDFVLQYKSLYGFFNEDFDKVTLKNNEYFLMGDNRPISRDSRDLGPFSSSQILSKDFFTIYPAEKFGYYA